MKQDTYLGVLRLIAFVVALFLWGMSAYFSVDGFNVQLPDMAWAGVGLALSVTAIELIWNKAGREAGAALYVIGFLAYGYSIWTNIVGIMQMQGHQLAFSVDMVFPFLLGFVLDIVPEPLIVWALIGQSFGGDFVTNVLENFGYQHREMPRQQQRQEEKSRPQGQRPQPTGKSQGKLQMTPEMMRQAMGQQQFGGKGGNHRSEPVYSQRDDFEETNF
jgi:hypothetical protein